MKLNKRDTSRKISSLRKTLVALAMPFTATPGHAAIFTVNNVGDGGVGCTLREAVQTANANINLNNGCGVGSALGLDAIEFLVSDVALANGEIEITDDVEINPSGNNVTINANSTSRIFNIQDAEVTLNGLTLTGGSPQDNEDGGAIYISQGGLTMQRCVVYGNTAASQSGGGVAAFGTFLSISNSRFYNNAAESDGAITDRSDTLTITNSQITSNTATAYDVGGVFVGSDTATITGSTISGNSAISSGGGLSFNKTTASILNSTISNNFIAGKSDDGDFFGGRWGGLEAEESTLTITNSQINANTATGSGGGVYSLASTIDIKDSSISGNRAEALGEIFTAIGGGGIFITQRSSSFGLANSEISLQESTLDNNFSGRDGGGILIAAQAGNGAAIAFSVNSTISNNSAAYLGGGIRLINEGGFAGYFSTISENTSGLGAGGISAFGASAEILLESNIVAGNRSNFSSKEIRLSSGATFRPSSEGNVFGQSEYPNNQSFYGVSINNDNIFATSDSMNPQALNQIILPLSANGGRTRTHALPAGSVAIDNGAASICGFLGSRDQRGPNNRTDGQCDIGSVEFFIEEDLCVVIPMASSRLVAFCL